MSTMNIFDMTDTWNNGATNFTAIKMAVTDTASASGSLLVDLQVGGSSQFNGTKAGRWRISAELSGTGFEAYSTGAKSVSTDVSGRAIQIGSNLGGGIGGIGVAANYSIIWSSVTGGAADINIAGNGDLFLTRDAADTLAQRNGVNAQALRLYNTFTDASNYERGKIEWASNVLRIGTEKAGTGTARALELQTDGATRLTIGTTGGLTTSSNIFVSGDVRVDAAKYFYWTGRSLISSPADSQVLLQNQAGTDFNRLQFGGMTSSFPSLKRNSTALETKLADDSAYAPHAMQYLDVTDGVTAPAAATGRARIYVDTADGDLKVIFADGTIKTIVTDT
jgi:hypothetical protein